MINERDNGQIIRKMTDVKKKGGDVMTDELSDEMIQRSEELLEEGKIEESEEVSEELVELNPDDALALYVRGKTLYMDEQFEEALAVLSKSAELDRERPETWTMIGLCLMALNRVDEAVDPLEYAWAKDPDILIAGYALGLARLLKGETDKAEELFETVLKKDPKRFMEYTNQMYNRLIAPSQISSTTKSYIEREIERIRLKYGV